MNVLILSSASTDIDPYYISIAKGISKYLAENEFDLVFGAAAHSMMGVCYYEFIRHNRIVYAFTTEKYQNDLENLKQAKHFIRQTTFEMKKSMFENSDLVVVLPGGIGTLSELLSYVEENRSNNKDIPIEIYDEDGYYQKLFEMLEFMKEKKFVSGDITNLVSISHDKYEFQEHINKYLVKKRRV